MKEVYTIELEESFEYGDGYCDIVAITDTLEKAKTYIIESIKCYFDEASKSKSYLKAEYFIDVNNIVFDGDLDWGDVDFYRSHDRSMTYKYTRWDVE